METQIIASFIGALGIAANVLIYQQKTGKNLLIYKLVSDILWASHYLVLGGYSAAAIACIGIVRESIFLNQKHKWAQSRIWLWLFVVLSVLSAALTWKNLVNLLPATASVLSVFGFWKNNPKLSKFLAFPISLCMLTYDLYIVSYMGIANETFTLISAMFSVILLLKQKALTNKQDKTESVDKAKCKKDND